MTMQQVMDMVQRLQEAVAASKVEQERMQADLAASQARNEELHHANEELHRGWHNNLGHHDISEPEQFTPPRGFSAPFSQLTLETKTKGGVVMVVERPPISDTPMEVGPLGATPAGATPIEDARTEGRYGDASPIEEVYGEASPMEEASGEATPDASDRVTPTEEDHRSESRAESVRDRRPLPVDNVVERQIGGKMFKLGRWLAWKNKRKWQP